MSSSKLILQNQETLNYFAKLREDDFTKQILMPLFRALGWKRVEFRGGATEAGRDLILEKLNEVDEVEVSVVAVKKFSGTTKAADKSAFQTAVLQLYSARQVQVCDQQGITRLPHRLFLITPNSISTVEYENVQQELRDEIRNRTTILDGQKISELIHKRCPDLLAQILRPSGRLRAYAERLPKNVISTQYYRVDQPKAIANFHVELNSHVEKSSVLFKRKSNEERTFSLAHRMADDLLDTASVLLERFGLEIISDSSENIPLERNKLKLLLSQRDQLAVEVNEIRSKYFKSESWISKMTTSIHAAIGDIEHQIEDSRHTKEIDIGNALADQKILRRLHEEMAKFFESGFGLSTEAWLKYSEVESDGVDRTAIQRVKNFLADLLVVSHCAAEISTIHRAARLAVESRLLEARVQMDRAKLEEQIQPLTETKIATRVEPLVQRLNECVRIIQDEGIIDSLAPEKIRRIRDACALVEFVCVSRVLLELVESEYTSVRKSNTKKITPLNKFLQLGECVLVTGEAGAGKSTSLLAFANQSMNSEKFSLFFSLASLAERMTPESCNPEGLLIAMSEMVKSSGIVISASELSEELDSGQCSVLLDALDEATNRLPGLADAIRMFAGRYSKLQIVVTSRNTGQFGARLCFLPIHLRKFTKKQLSKFIRSYLKGRTTRNRIKEIVTHLKDQPSLAQVVRTPLLAAVLCEVACVRQNLPQTEVTLYQDRMKLLSGDIDLVKKIPSRTSFMPRDIQTVCERIATHMHVKCTRAMKIDEIIAVVKDTCSNLMALKNLENLVNELMDPCQILVPMDESGGVGFGHLRFQEFLVGCAMQSWELDRFTKILSDEWWHAPIRLWALMKDDLLPFFEKYPITIQGRNSQLLLKTIFRGKSPVVRAKIIEDLKNNDKLFGDRSDTAIRRLLE